MKSIGELAIEAVTKLTDVQNKLSTLRNEHSTLRSEVAALRSEVAALKRVTTPSLVICATAETDFSITLDDPPFKEFDVVYTIHSMVKLSTGEILNGDRLAYSLEVLNFRQFAQPRDVRYIFAPDGNVTHIPIATNWYYNCRYLFLLSVRYGTLESQAIVEMTPTLRGDLATGS